MASLTTSHVRGATTSPLIEQSIGAFLGEAATRWPGREALVVRHQGIRWSFAELQARARRAGRALVASGIEPGERIGIWATNVPEWLELQFGAAYAGAIVVPLNPLYRRSEVEFVLGKARAAACFVLPENRGASLWEIALAVAMPSRTCALTPSCPGS